MARVRPYEQPADREFVVDLAPRLTIGIPTWRDRGRMLTAAQRWVDGSIARRGAKAEVFVAVGADGQRLGFATVAEEVHFTGETQAYIGELATIPEAEGLGVGTAMVLACEEWARRRGYRILSLATGAANARALGFYRHLGFADEDVKLVKILDASSTPQDR